MGADLTQPAGVEDAIARILGAEREARESVARCELECAQRLAAARDRAREIGARAERRSSALARRIDDNAERRVRELEQTPATSPGARDAASADETLDRAAAALVRELTGVGE